MIIIIIIIIMIITQKGNRPNAVMAYIAMAYIVMTCAVMAGIIAVRNILLIAPTMTAVPSLVIGVINRGSIFPAPPIVVDGICARKSTSVVSAQMPI